MAFKNFSFSNVNVIFGILELQEFGEGDDVVSIVFDEDAFQKLVGAKGDIVRTQTNDSSGTVTIKLLQTSASNAELTTLFLADRASGAGVQPMFITDKESGETYTMNNAWISKYPDVTRGQSPNTMDWVFQFDYMTPVVVAV